MIVANSDIALNIKLISLINNYLFAVKSIIDYKSSYVDEDYYENILEYEDKIEQVLSMFDKELLEEFYLIVEDVHKFRLYSYILNQGNDIEDKIIMFQSKFEKYALILSAFYETSGDENKKTLAYIDTDNTENKKIYSYETIKKEQLLLYGGKIHDFIVSSVYPVTTREILNMFGEQFKLIVYDIVADPDILDYSKAYFAKKQVKIEAEELESLEKICDSVLADNKQHYMDELMPVINSKEPYFVSRNFVNTSYRLYSVLSYAFENKYRFSWPYISNVNTTILSQQELTKEYLGLSPRISISEFIDFTRKAGIEINSIVDYLNSCNDKYLIENRENLIAIEEVGLSDEKIEEICDLIRDEIMEKDLLPLRELECSIYFPELNIKISEWLIYSIVKKYMKDMQVGLSNSKFRKAIPMISNRFIEESEKEEIALKYKNSAEEHYFYQVNSVSDVDNIILNNLDDYILAMQR